jgi:hypothetical protein
LGKKQGENELGTYTDSETATKVSSLLYCQPPEDFFITSEDMVGKSGVWAHFGIWNFQRAEIYNYFKTDKLPEFIVHLQEQYNYSKDDAQKIYFEISAKRTDREINDWVATWPSYLGASGCSESEGILDCNVQISSNQVIPLQINISGKEAYVQATKGGIFYPNAFTYVENGTFIIKRYNESQIGYAAALLPDNRTVILMSEELAGSMFTRLFYYDGLGLDRFKKFNDLRDITGARIITWKIDWSNE